MCFFLTHSLHGLHFLVPAHLYLLVLNPRSLSPPAGYQTVCAICSLPFHHNHCSNNCCTSDLIAFLWEWLFLSWKNTKPNCETRKPGCMADWLLLSESPVIDLVQHSAVSLQVIQTAKSPLALYTYCQIRSSSPMSTTSRDQMHIHERPMAQNDMAFLSVTNMHTCMYTAR